MEYPTLQNAKPAFRLDGRPFLDLGGLRTNPMEELDPRQGNLSAVELSDGRIVVNERTQVKVFSRTGAVLGVFGRIGSGPGEFQQVREVCRLTGDSLLVLDGADGRVSRWSPGGTLVRTFARPGIVPFGGCTSDGWLVVHEPGAAVVVSDQGEAYFDYRLIHPDGVAIRDLGLLPAHEYSGPIVRDPTIVPVADDLYVGDARTYEVRIRRFSGRILRIIRVLEPPPAVTEATWEALVETMVPANVTGEARARLIARFKALKRPATFPAFHRFFVDPAGRIWIEAYQNSRLLHVFDSSGELVGRVDLPTCGPPATPLASALAGLARDHVMVRCRDENGAPHIQFYRLR